MSRVSSSVGIGSPPCGSGSGGGGGGGGGVGGGGGGGGPCGACKFLRRKCVSGCIFAPYFNSVQGAAHFSAVHKVFGASNVSKLLRLIPPYKRLDAVVTICYEAQLRIRDPVYGCVGRILALQQQVANLQAELSCLQTHLAPQEPPPVTHAPPSQASPAAFFTPELPLPSLLPGTFDLSTLFDPPLLLPWPPPLQQQQLDLRQLGRSGGGELTDNNQDGGDMQDLARELMERYSSASAEQPLSK